jgi:hypothetical protein
VIFADHTILLLPNSSEIKEATMSQTYSTNTDCIENSGGESCREVGACQTEMKM